MPLAKRRENKISEKDLVNWATMLMINDAFFWKDEEAVGRWVNRLGLDLMPED